MNPLVFIGVALAGVAGLSMLARKSNAALASVERYWEAVLSRIGIVDPNRFQVFTEVARSMLQAEAVDFTVAPYRAREPGMGESSLSGPALTTRATFTFDEYAAGRVYPLEASVVTRIQNMGSAGFSLTFSSLLEPGLAHIIAGLEGPNVGIGQVVSASTPVGVAKGEQVQAEWHRRHLLAIAPSWGDASAILYNWQSARQDLR